MEPTQLNIFTLLQPISDSRIGFPFLDTFRVLSCCYLGVFSYCADIFETKDVSVVPHKTPPSSPPTGAQLPASTSTCLVVTPLLALGITPSPYDNTTTLVSTPSATIFSHEKPASPAQTSSSSTLLSKTSPLQTTSPFSRRILYTATAHNSLLTEFSSTSSFTAFDSMSLSQSSSHPSYFSSQNPSSPLTSSSLAIASYFRAYLHP